ncbi:hypothetical protein JW824_10300 [bacterium]|nr:hypothetical protein [bacterium]RQV94098.1 MAG: hypothetical protein EH221_08335 [bacterium]
MNKVIHLKEIEKRAFRSTFQDGLWDIFLGVLLLNLSIFPWLTEEYMSPFSIVIVSLTITIVVFIGFLLGKRYLTVLRIGILRVGSDRKSKLKKLHVVLIVSVAGTTALLFFTRYLNQFSRIPIPFLIFGIQAIIVFSIGAYLLSIDRLYLYGIFFAFPLPTGYALAKAQYSIFELIIVAAIPSLIMIIIGIVFFTKFLLNYPVTREEN